MTTEQERQDNFISKYGRDKCERLNRIYNNSYPKFCSIPYGEEYPKNHTKEEVFKADSKKDGFSMRMVTEFLSL